MISTALYPNENDIAVKILIYSFAVRLHDG